MTKLPWNLLLAVLATATLTAPAISQTPANAAPPIAAPQTTAPATTPPVHNHGFQIPKIGIDLGIYLPTAAKTRNRFGSSWDSIGIGFGRPERPSGAGEFEPDFSLIENSTGDDHAYVAPLGVAYRRAFSAADLKDDHTFVPYYGLSADLVAMDLRAPEDDVRWGLRFTAGGSAIVGTAIGKSGFLEAKYTAIGKVEGFDFSGYSLTAGIRF